MRSLWVLAPSWGNDLDFDAQRSCQQVGPFTSGIHLKVKVVGVISDRFDPHPAVIDVDAHRLYNASVATVETNCHAQHPGELSNESLIIHAQGGELWMLLARSRLAVVTRHDSDQLDLVLGKASQLFAVPDHVVRVLVMT